MAITASQLKIVIRGAVLGQQAEVVQWYRPVGAAFLTADPVSVGEAFWNDIKTAWRGCHLAAGNDVTTSVFVSEPGDTGAYGEYAIPSGEQHGTRVEATEGVLLPPFCAAAARQTVATRVTRPGQKRFWGGLEVDHSSGVWFGAYLTLVATLMAKFSEPVTLGAPVALGELDPIVVHIDRASGDITQDQLITGFIFNTNVSTQNSRKFGRGA